MKKSMWTYIAVVVFGLAAWPANPGRAQEAAKPVTEAKAALAEAQKAAADATPVYHLVFVVRELDGDKTINSRAYVMSAQEHDWDKIRMKTIVPIQVGENSYQNHEVGIGIDCRLEQHEDEYLVSFSFNQDSLAAPAEATPGKASRPVIRNVNLQAQSLVTPGKPKVIGALDDLATNHRFEIELTATKVK